MMIKLKDIITERVSPTIVKKVLQFRNPKFIEAEYKLSKGKEKDKFKVKKTHENDSFYFINVSRVKERPKEFNNFEFVIDKKKLTIKFIAKMGMMPSLISDKILSIKVK
jgi:hypothetical protein